MLLNPFEYMLKTCRNTTEIPCRRAILWRKNHPPYFYGENQFLRKFIGDSLFDSDSCIPGESWHAHVGSVA